MRTQVEIFVARVPAGVGHMDPTSHFEVVVRDWSKPYGERETRERFEAGDRDAAHRRCRELRAQQVGASFVGRHEALQAEYARLSRDTVRDPATGRVLDRHSDRLDTIHAELTRIEAEWRDQEPQQLDKHWRCKNLGTHDIRCRTFDGPNCQPWL